MSKHKPTSASPGLHRDERAGGAVTASPTTEIAELDAGPAVENPSIDSSAQRQGMHDQPGSGSRKRRG